MPETEKSLTGVWHGLYTYPRELQPVYFMATLIQSGGHLSGTTHEAEKGEDGAPLALFAMIGGARSGASVVFSKTYDGSAGWTHDVAYDGRLDDAEDEIEGRWTIAPTAERPGLSGRFMMMRSSGASEKTARQAFEKV